MDGLKNPEKINHSDANTYLARKVSECKRIIESSASESQKTDAMNEYMVLCYIRNNLSSYK